MFQLAALTLEDIAPHLYDPQWYTVYDDSLTDKLKAAVATINQLLDDQDDLKADVESLRTRIQELETQDVD